MLTNQRRPAGPPAPVHYPIPLNRPLAVADASVQLPVGDAIAQRVISLPMHPYLDDGSIRRITQAVASTFS